MKKKKLKTGLQVNMEIQSLKEEIAALKNNIESLSCLQLKERTQGGDISPDGVIINKLSKLYELQDKLRDLVGYQLEIAEEIELLDDWLERVVMRYRYINNLTFEELAERIGYSKKQVERVHKRAKENFFKISAKCR